METNIMESVRIGATYKFDSPKQFKEYLSTLEVMPPQYNRAVTEAHVQSMKESIENIGVQRAVVVVITDAFNGTETKYIADGQHMTDGILNIDDEDLRGHFVAVENHIDEIENIIPFVSVMNSTARNWTLMEYLDAWCTDGKEDYIFIREQLKQTGFSLNPLLECYTGERSEGNKKFKNGKFVANKELGQDNLIDYYNAIKMGLYLNNSSFGAFVRILVDFKGKGVVKHKGEYRTLDMPYLLNQIAKNKQLFGNEGNREMFFNLLRTLGLKQVSKPKKTK